MPYFTTDNFPSLKSAVSEINVATPALLSVGSYIFTIYLLLYPICFAFEVGSYK
jgi:hypothetical protein